MIPFSSLVRGAAKESRTELAQAMIDARLEAGYTQAELAELMSTSQSTITRMESGKDMLTVATLEKWAEVTGKRLEIRLFSLLLRRARSFVFFDALLHLHL